MGKSKEEALKIIQESDKPEFEVFTTDEHKTFLENYEQDVVDKKLKSRVSEIHQQYDDDLFKLIGKRKTPNQKTYNFLEEVINDLKSQAKDAPELKAQIEKLKEDIKNGEGAETIKKDLESVKNQYSEDKAKWDAEKAELLTSKQEMQLGNELDKALVGIKFKESIPENVRAIMISTVKDSLVKKAKIVDSKLIFVGSEGETLRNPDNGLNPFTAEEMLRTALKDIIGEERVITGTGVKPEITGEGDKKDIHISVPATIKTKDQLSEYLLEQGLTRDSEEYKLAYAKYSPNLKYS